MADENRVVLHLDLDTLQAEQKLDDLRKQSDTIRIPVEVNTSTVQRTVNEMVEDAQEAAVDIPVNADVGSITEAVGAAVDSIQEIAAEIPFRADTGSIPEDIRVVTEFIQETPAEIYVFAETSAAREAIHEVAESVPTVEIPVQADTEQADKSLNRIGSLLEKIRGHIQKFRDNAKEAFRKISENSDKTNQSFGMLNATGKQLAGTLGSLFAVGSIIRWGKACVSASTETENALRGLQSILDGQGRSFSGAQGFINDYISDGLVPLQNAVTAYKNLAARGYDDTQIQSVMNALKDSAAYGRQASYSLGDAVTSATEGLKNENSILVDNAGVTKNVAKMWDEYARSIGTTSNNLTQAQKIQAEVNGILTETRFQTGDAAKVAGTFSGQVSQLNANMTALRSVVGDFLKTAVAPYIRHINNAVRVTTIFLETIAKALGISTDVSGTQALGDSIAQAAVNTDMLTDALHAAKAAQEQLQAASFDDFNVIGEPQSNADTGASAADIAAPGFDTGAFVGSAEAAGESLDELRRKAESFADTWLVGWNAIKYGWEDYKDSWAVGMDMIGDGFKFFWKKAKEGYSEFKDEWRIGMGMIGDGFKSFFEKIENDFSEFGDNWRVGIDDIKEKADEFKENWGVGAADIRQKFSDIKEKFKDFKDNWKAGWNTVKSNFNDFKSNWRSGVEDIKKKFKDFRSDWKSGFDEIRNKASEKWDSVCEKIKSPFNSIGDWFHDKFSNAWQRVLDVFSKGGVVFQGIQDGISGVFKETVNNLIDGINNVVHHPFSAVNDALRGLRDWSFMNVRPFEWVPEISIPQIPRLARGGLVSQPTLAMVGDNPNAHSDPEIISPLSKLKGMLSEPGSRNDLSGEKLSRMIQLMEELISEVKNLDFSFNIGDREVHNASKRYERRTKKMKGEAAC